MSNPTCGHLIPVKYIRKNCFEIQHILDMKGY